MVNLVLKFVSSSRAAGLRISTSEVLDCLNQLKLIDITDEPQFITVLRSNFAKSLSEQSKFDHFYHLFFHELREDENLVNSDSIAPQIKEVIEALKDKDELNHTLQAILDFLAGNPIALLDELRQLESEGDSMRTGIGANLGPMTRRLSIMLLLENSRKGVSQFLSQNQSSIHWETRKGISSYFNKRIDSAHNLLTQSQRPHNDNLKKVISYDQRLNKLGKQSFSSLAPKEVEEMREIIAQMVKKLKDTFNFRYISNNRGILDVKKTLRRAAKYQGIPLEVIYRKKPKRKSKIVVLCDVSGSVWSAAKFMLNMLYSLQECFTKVRSFIFIAGLDEVTKIFENNEINQAIDKVLNEADINYHASTDYGLTFRKFKQNHMDVLNKKTTLIIIGDGRTNYGNPEEQILDEMREKSRRIIWLNPENEQFWYSGDSQMRTYQAYCHEVRVCQNLNQLLDFIRDLVL